MTTGAVRILAALLLVAAGVVFFSEASRAQSSHPFEFQDNDRILILAPHPDDETLGTGGVIQEAVRRHLPVKVVYLTNGDNNQWSFLVYKKRPVLSKKGLLKMGELRRQEAIDAMRLLGLDEKNLVFLGYPDYGTLQMFTRYWGHTKPFKALLTKARQVPYASSPSFGETYVAENILSDLKTQLLQFKPTKVFVTNPSDTNRDHQAYYLFLRVALWDLKGWLPPPQIYPFIIHSEKWPQPRGLQPDQPLQPPAALTDTRINWSILELTPDHIQQKAKALDAYKTQTAYSAKYLNSFVRTNELFGDLPEILLRRSPDGEINWDELDLAENITSEPEAEAQKDGRVIKTITYALDHDYLYIRIRSLDLLERETGINLFLLGYRKGIPFSAMPKFRIYIDYQNNAIVFERHRTVMIKDVHITPKGKDIYVQFPLNELHFPDYVFSCVRTRMGKFPLEASAWRVLSLTGEDQP